TRERPTGQGVLGTRVADLLDTYLLLAADPAQAEWLRASVASDAWARDEVFRAEQDLTGLRAEANISRYRPVPLLAVRAGADGLPVEVGRMVLAAACAGVPVEVSLHPAVATAAEELLPAKVIDLGWGPGTDEEVGGR